MQRLMFFLLAFFSVIVSNVNAEEDKGLLGGFFDNLSLDLRTVENTNGGIAADFKWNIFQVSMMEDDITLPVGNSWTIDYLLSAKLNTEGMLGSKSAEDDNTPREINIGADLDLKAIYFDFGGFDYKMWMGVTAGEIEADQDLNQVNYVFKPFLCFDVPFTAGLSKGIQQILGTGLNDCVYPIWIEFGYSLISELEGDESHSAEDRFEFTAFYSIETYKSIQFKFKYRFFYEFDKNYDLVEFTVGFPIIKNESKVILKYIEGELPLSLRKSESLSIGLSLSL